MFPPPPHPLLIPPHPTVPQLNPHCASMYPHCILTVPHCTLTVSPLYPPCTLTVSSFPPPPHPLLLPPSSIMNLNYHDHCFFTAIILVEELSIIVGSPVIIVG